MDCNQHANLLCNSFLIVLFRRYFMFGRYAGYTQGSSEYSVKSLTEREAAKLLSCPNGVQRLYSPCHNIKIPAAANNHG